ncbi:hypothetical protein BAG01nite_33670 [Brevibacillus agri]|uniref:Iron-sulfur cluster biosynthesis family protein n=1 Tax=Brevibacillus agri TaxID=51101 RepID=A0A3M8B5U5_9BACL|nr:MULTISPECIES: iron-sulfur cluster biosynthesis family protein [Brevibacillus]ELK39468.1 hypothetical protein D478_24078 [Brevibacillus agri BAB-2500]EJL39492.1 hypothetical protein PMI08_05004 [Brevibacillus sp. CF112]MBY0053771.1 iron-sulfur cluster biosynthesis family protein [Brevibacillus agri]MCG5254304.1 iron-sulfur cluster biosynthesis family protein [Brevibacillus agri]MDR9505536.1 iron-sulfur cluster biosynthesis family protein [Brevibacillus agri]
MRIKLTKEAVDQLQKATRPVRINGELVGGCGMTVEYALWLDEATPQDQVIQVEGMTLLLDPETIAYIGSEALTIDYRPQQGFRLVTPEQIVAYGLSLKERWG